MKGKGLMENTDKHDDHGYNVHAFNMPMNAFRMPTRQT